MGVNSFFIVFFNRFSLYDIDTISIEIRISLVGIVDQQQFRNAQASRQIFFLCLLLA